MLDSLNDQTVGDFRLVVEYLGQVRFFDQRGFSLYLLDSHSKKSNSPIFRGLYNTGRPSSHIPAWIDGEFVENATIKDESLNLSASATLIPTLSLKGRGETLAESIAQKLGALIPPGGRFWLAYEAFEGEGEMMRETRMGLLASIPLVTTPIGFLLYRADCWLGLRDWLFPEGGREGPRKLQGNKAVNAEHARQRAGESIRELEKFLQQRAGDEIMSQAQARAKIILPAMKTIVYNS